MMMDNAEFERAVIGSILLDPICLADVSAIVAPGDFASEVNRTIYDTMLNMSLNGQAIDALTVADKLGAAIKPQVLIEALEVTPTAANATVYAELVHKAAKRRRLIAMGAKLIDEGRAGAEPGDMTAEIYAELEAIESGGPQLIASDRAAADFADYRMTLDRDGITAAINTGISGWDTCLGGGLTNGELHILAARPGVGKTTFAVHIADAIAERGINVLFVSLEMSARQITAKRYAIQTGISLGKLLNGRLSPSEQKLIGPAYAKISKLPLVTLAKRNLTVNDIALAARRAKGTQLIVIDYLSYIRPTRQREKRYEEFSDISNALKDMASTLNIPVLCLAQLNREYEKRGNKRPILSSLRESGMIEQDAASVTFIHRTDEYGQNDPDEFELVVAKSRYSTKGIVKMLYYMSTGQYVELEGEREGDADGN
jgi:replicative DNA helicase